MLPPPPATDELAPRADAPVPSSASGASTAATGGGAGVSASTGTAPAEEVPESTAAAAPGEEEEEEEEKEKEEKEKEEDGGGEEAMDAAAYPSGGGDADLPQTSGEQAESGEPCPAASLPGPPAPQHEAPGMGQDATAVISVGSDNGSPAGLHGDVAVVATAEISRPVEPAGGGAVVARDAAGLSSAAGDGALEVDRVGKAAAAMPGGDAAEAPVEVSTENVNISRDVLE